MTHRAMINGWKAQNGANAAHGVVTKGDKVVGWYCDSHRISYEEPGVPHRLKDAVELLCRELLPDFDENQGEQP